MGERVPDLVGPRGGRGERATTSETGATATTQAPKGTRGKPPSQPASAMPMILLLVAMFAIMYFLLIRPQKKKERDRQEMLKRLRKNAQVVTAGGIHGTIVSMTETDVTLRVDDNCKIKLSRGSIGRILSESSEESS